MISKKTHNSLKDILNYHIIPPIFLIVFTSIVPVLVRIGNPKAQFTLESLIGNGFAWLFVSGVVGWALLWLWIPSQTFNGPPTPFGYIPIYKANGLAYYIASLGLFGLVVITSPGICISIYNNFGPILAALNILALSLCVYLLVKAKLKTDEKDPYLRENTFPIGHEFYRGMELHPRIFGVDVKQLTNCRIGLMLWQWLVVVYFIAGYQLHGLNPGHLSSAILHTVYLFKFYYWETGYFNTLDITMDRAGYYLCWGCLVWVPAFFTLNSFFLVHHHQSIVGSSYLFSGLITILGLAFIYYNYDVDRQKQVFINSSLKDQIEIFGRKPESIKVTYKLNNGIVKETNLLVSGWWGVARKINYTFELGIAYTWCCGAGLDYGLWPFLYAFFLTILLLHRIHRDEDKCLTKYGSGWTKYCQRVPYRLIPYIY